MQPVYFPINENNFMKFTRDIPKPRDCVINAMHLVNVIDKKHAELMRILVGDIGITVKQIEDIFNYLSINFSNTPSRWRYFFQPFNLSNTTDRRYIELYINSLMPLNVLFCGMTYSMGGDRHVFIIARDSAGIVGIVDPQSGGFQLDMYSYISRASELFILSRIK